MRKLFAAILAAAMLLCLTACGAPKKAELSLFAMDTYMTLVAYGDEAEDALAEASRTINDLESRLSRTREGSEIWTVNHRGTADLDAETSALLANALALSAETDGRFDITVAPLVEAWAIHSDHPRVPGQDETGQLGDGVVPLRFQRAVDVGQNGRSGLLPLGIPGEFGGTVQLSHGDHPLSVHVLFTLYTIFPMSATGFLSKFIRERVLFGGNIWLIVLYLTKKHRHRIKETKNIPQKHILIIERKQMKK
jgi:hypothetical protein